MTTWLITETIGGVTQNWGDEFEGTRTQVWEYINTVIGGLNSHDEKEIEEEINYEYEAWWGGEDEPISKSTHRYLFWVEGTPVEAIVTIRKVKR